jgi:hypothetical protein
LNELAGDSISNNESDNTPPTTSITHSPISNITTATQLMLTATASDLSGISSIEIFADNILKKSCASPPCSFTSTYSAGSHTYYATAKDSSPNKNLGRDPISGTKSFDAATTNLKSYSYYVKCKDGNGNMNIDDFKINFSI